MLSDVLDMEDRRYNLLVGLKLSPDLVAAEKYRHSQILDTSTTLHRLHVHL